MVGQASQDTNHDDRVQRNELTLPAMLITLHVMAFVPLTIAFLVGYAAGYVNVGLVIVGATQLLYALPGFQDHNEIAWLYTYAVAQVLLGVMELAWSICAFVKGNPIGIGVVLFLLSLLQFAMAFIALKYRDFTVSERYAAAYESVRRRKKAWNSEKRDRTAPAATAPASTLSDRPTKGSGNEIVDELPVPLVVQKRDQKTRKANSVARTADRPSNASQASVSTQQHAAANVDSDSPSLCAPPVVNPPVTGTCKLDEQHKSVQRKPLVRMKTIREESRTKDVPALQCAPVVVEKRTYTWTKSSPLPAQNVDKQLAVRGNRQQNAARPAVPTTITYTEDEESDFNDDDFTLTTHHANVKETPKQSTAEAVVNATTRPEPSIFEHIFGGKPTEVPEANKKRIPTPLPSFSKLPATPLINPPNDVPPKPKENTSATSKPLTLNPAALIKKDAEVHSSESCECEDCKPPRKKRYYFVRKSEPAKGQPTNELKTVATMSSSTLPTLTPLSGI